MRNGERAVFGFGLVLVTIFHLGIGFATTPLAITLLFAVVASLGIGHSGAVPSQAVVSRWFVRRRGLAMGLTAFGLALGGGDAAQPRILNARAKAPVAAQRDARVGDLPGTERERRIARGARDVIL